MPTPPYAALFAAMGAPSGAGLRRWVKGGQPSHEHLNEPVDWINAFAESAGLGLPGGLDDPFGRPFLATVVDSGPTGESDLEGPMYWVQEAYFVGSTNANALRTTPTIAEDQSGDADNGQRFHTFPALNIAEYLSNTHYVSANEIVWVFPIYEACGKPNKPEDPALTKQRRFVFSSVPAIRDIRYNSTTHTLQVAYQQEPEESDWVDKITFTAC